MQKNMLYSFYLSRKLPILPPYYVALINVQYMMRKTTAIKDAYLWMENDSPSDHISKTLDIDKRDKNNLSD